MKKLFFFLFFFFFFFFFKAQSISEIKKDFWNSVDKRNNIEITLKGEQILSLLATKNLIFDTTIAEIILFTANGYSQLGNYKRSLELNFQALRIFKKTVGKFHPKYLSSLNNIAYDYEDLGNFSKSLKYNLLALKRREMIYGKEDYNYSTSLHNIASNYSNLGDQLKSLTYNLLALKIREKIKDKKSDYALTLNNIAANYTELGYFQESIKFNLLALKTNENLFGREHYSYATSLNNLAVNYSNLGEYAKALNANIIVLNIREKFFGKEHPYYASSLNNIADNYSDLGDYTNALKYNEEALKIREKLLGKEHCDYALSLHNLASNYSNLGDYYQSLEYNLKALNIREKIYGKNHPSYGLSLINIATNYYNIGNYIKSLTYNFLAIKIYEEIYGKNHQLYASCLANIASNYYKLRNYKESLKYNLQALKIREETYGNNHFIYSFSLNNIALNYLKLGSYSKCSNYLFKSLKCIESSFDNNKFGLHAPILESFKYNIVNVFQINLNLFIKDTIKTRFIYNSWLNLNGILSSNYKNLEHEIFLSKDTLLISQLEKLKFKKRQYLKIQELSNKYNPGEEAQKLQEEINSIERGLSSKSKSFSNFNRYFYSNDISKNLNSNEYLVDFLRVPRYNFNTNQWTDSTQYLVFITDSKDTLVDYVFIEDGTKIDQDLFDQYKLEATDPENKTDLKSEKFYNYFWKPIADKIGDAKTIYVSLGGVYNNINLNTIYNPETGKYLIEEKDIRIVNSARDFVLSKESEKKNYTTNTASLFGFPNFDGNMTVSADTSDLFASTRDLNSFWLDSLTRGGMKAKPLPATKTEVENISTTLKSKGWQVNSFLADNASETNIKKQQSPRILHVATHGYFFQDIPMEKDNTRFLGMNRQLVVQDPMLRSGLLLTGANKTLKGETTTGENGLLSASEAALLDLRETELVVLSACETGKGEVKNSEGVYGLRKAFSDAGAQNIIMSLWKVDDKVTQEFMSRFYEIWLNEKISIREAFNKTQLEIKAKHPQPYYWGAFILVGE